jgi:excisionase family DNA binding protein
MPEPARRPLPGSAADSPFLTVAEIAAAARVSKMTIYRLISSGDLPAGRVGRSVRVRRSDFQAAFPWLAAGIGDAPPRRRPALGGALRAARRAAGWSQADLAGKIGCSQDTVSTAEREGHKPRLFWQAADHALGTGGTLAAEFDHTHHPA